MLGSLERIHLRLLKPRQGPGGSVISIIARCYIYDQQRDRRMSLRLTGIEKSLDSMGSRRHSRLNHAASGQSYGRFWTVWEVMIEAKPSRPDVSEDTRALGRERGRMMILW